MPGEWSTNDGKLTRALDWIIDLQPAEISHAVSALRLKHPSATNEDLARRVFADARWKAAASGAVTGMPANLFVAAPAALLDASAVLRLEAQAAARVAMLYDPDFLNDEDARWELFVPVFGLSVVSQIARQAGVRAGMAASRQVMRKVLSKSTVIAFKQILVRHFGIRVGQRALVTKTVPVVGALIGGVWNFGEVTLLRERCVRYFAGKELGVIEPEPKA